MSTIPNQVDGNDQAMMRFATFAIPFNRVLWKEYRVHRTLWLSCLSLGCMFQFTFSFLSYDESTFNSLLTLPIVFTVMYAIGCGTILFASEREERTCDWLMSLSVPPGPIFAAKICFAVVSTLSLQFILNLFLFQLVSREAINRRDSMDQLFDSTALTVLVWSILGSIVSRRVMSAVLAMVLWAVGTLVIPLMIFQWMSANFWTGSLPGQILGMRAQLIAILSLAVASVNAWLGWRWCQGRYFDGSVLERWNHGMSQYAAQLSSFPLIPSRISAQAECEQPWKRTWQRLVWSERKREQFHILFLITVCVVGIIFAVADHLRPYQAPAGPYVSQPFRFGSLTLLLCLATPIVMGILGFETDASLQQLRFLANRGISPGSVWLAKQAVWLTRAFWMTLLVVLSCFLIESLIVPSLLNPISPRFDQPQKTFERLLNQLRYNFDIAIWYILLTYGCSQLASMLLRRSILAFILAIVFSSVAFSWMIYVYQLSVPLWWSVGFPVIAMLAITLWQMKPRMLDDQSWSNRLKLCAAFVAAPAILLSAFASYRLTEVSLLPRLSIIPRLNSAWEAALAAGKNPRPASSAEELLARRIDSLTGPFQSRVTGAEIVELMKSDVRSIDMIYPSQRAYNVWTLTTEILNDADTSTKAGELEPALERYLACLKLARVTSARGLIDGRWSAGTWWSGCASQSITLEYLVNWANHPSQTPDSIRIAMDSIASELARFPSATRAIVESYLKDLWITRPMSYNDYVQWQTGTQLVRHTAFEVARLSIQPWERSRLRILMTREAELIFTYVAGLEKRLTEFPGKATGEADADAASVLLQLSPLMKPASESLEQIRDLVLQRQTEIRAALTRMELIAYRLEHDRLPDRLLELMENFDGRQLVDPWSDRIFDFYPTFLLSARPEGHNETSTRAAVLPTSQTTVAIGCVNCRNQFQWPYKSPLSDSAIIVPDRNALSSSQGPVAAHSSLFRIPAMPDANADHPENQEMQDPDRKAVGPDDPPTVPK